MSTLPPVFRTAEELFARAECAHIITMDNPNQNLHLERIPNGLKFTAGPPGREFSSLEELYSFGDAVWNGKPGAPDLRGAIWQDITDYPVFPDDVLYLPLDIPVELFISMNSEQVTEHGPHIIYGPAEISSTASNIYQVVPTAGWLVVEHPAATFRGGVRGILRPTHGILDRLRLKYDNYRLRHDTADVASVRPGITIVYGKPPSDWRQEGVFLTADQPTPTA